ncbi:MAG TPA: hypothetical protein PKA31_02020 [Candidatus Moranbacteria bacterium]|nr:hypothetical protein [Candidatus Moranbacteria bacterium]
MENILWISVAHAGVISEAPRLHTLGLNALNFLLMIAGIFAVCMFVVAGLKYFLAAGNEEAVSRAKKAATGALGGMVLAGLGMIAVRLVASMLER